jgi:monooxygenase
VTEEPLLDFNSGYVLRSIDHLPKQGSKEPWKLRQNYPVDLRMLRHGSIDDGTMQFSNPAPRPQAETQALASSS